MRLVQKSPWMLVERWYRHLDEFTATLGFILLLSAHVWLVGRGTCFQNPAGLAAHLPSVPTVATSGYL